MRRPIYANHGFFAGGEAAPVAQPEAEFIILDPETVGKPVPASRPDLAFADSGEQRNSAIKYPVTVGRKVALPSVIAIRDIAYVTECIKNGFVEGTDYRALIHTIRNQPNAELAKAMKQSLPWFCGAVCERFRSNASVKSAQFMLFDLDHVEDIEGLKAAALAKLPFIRYAFRSVRDGVKLIAQLDHPIIFEDLFRVIWRYAALQVEHALGHPVDSAPDWARACFFSFDPGLLHNSGFQPLEVDRALQEARLLVAMAACAEEDKAAEADRVKQGAGSGIQDRMEQRVKEKGEGGLSVTPASAGRTAGFSRLWEHGGTGGKNRINPVERPVDHPTTQQVVRRGPREAGVTPPRHPATTSPPSEDTFEKARTIVQQLATRVIPYSDWYRIGMALYAGFGERGRELWDLFLDNPHYRDTRHEMDKQWRSFARVHTISLETLFYLGGKHGCN